MGNEKESLSLDELAGIHNQCIALHEDWQRLYQMAAVPPNPDAAQRHMAFIQLQSRLSCDYPILSNWRKGNFGLASSIGKVVANAGTLEAFSEEVRAGNGPLVSEWQAVNESIVQVRTHLGHAQAQAKRGKPVRLPREIVPPRERTPLPSAWILKKFRIACIVLACCVAMFFVMRPVVVNTGLLGWLDDAYVRWQLRNSPDGLTIGKPPPK